MLQAYGGGPLASHPTDADVLPWSDVSAEWDSPLLRLLADRVMVADGGMGTMLQAEALTLDDFAGLDGCNEILNDTRPDVVRRIHRAYLQTGVDITETNTFGANLPNLAEYGIAHRIRELAEKGALLAREVADEFCTADAPRLVLGSVGPGTKLPTLGHATYRDLRDAYAECGRGLLAGGVDGLIVETCQDLLQAKAAIIGVQRAMADEGRRVPVLASVTVETTGTMLLGSEIGAALTALEPLGIDAIGLNCATGPAEMSEHLRTLAKQVRVPLTVMPNAGLPVLGPDGAVYPLNPEELAAALSGFVTEYGVRLVGGCCGTTPRHLAAVVDAVRGLTPAGPTPRPEPGVGSLYSAVPFRQDTSVLMIGERTNATGSKAFREAMLADRYEDCVAIAREQIRDGAHLIDLNVDYVGRDGAADMSELAARLATASTLPIMLDSTEPDVLAAGLERLGGRCIVNSVNYEDGDGPDSRFTRTMRLVAEHGAAVVASCIDEEGQARTAQWKVRVAERLIADLERAVGDAAGRHRRRLSGLPDHHRAGGGAPGRAGDDRGDSRAEAPAPGRADHPRGVQRLLRAERRRPPGAELGVPARVRARRAGHRDRARLEDRADRPDRLRAAGHRPGPDLRPAPAGHRRHRGLRPVATRSWRCSRGSRHPRRGRAGPRSSPRCRCSNGCSAGSSTGSATV